MGLNFPNAPIQGQVFVPVGAPQYVFLDGVWRVLEAPQDIGTAQARNRIVNGAMQISQENGNTAGTASSYYAADQWFTLKVHSAGTMTSQRVQSVTPNGSKDRYRVTITAADTALAAGEHLSIRQNIEGLRVADFLYGSASAKQFVLRFGFKGPAGTYAVALQNDDLSRSYVVLFTIAAGQANIDTVQTFIIPGDTTGTWLADTGAGIKLIISLAVGTTFQGVAGWQAGSFVGTSAVSNGMAIAGAVYELFEVGLYLDPQNTGIAPPWQMPDEAEELRACQRYFTKIDGVVRAHSGVSAVAAGYGIYNSALLPVAMRSQPAMTALAGTVSYTNAQNLSISANGGGSILWVATSAAAGTWGVSFTPVANSRM